MKSVLIIERISVQDANGLSGLTYGFPAMSHFLGFTHALSREISRKFGLSFGGCGVVCHQHEFRGIQVGKGDEYSPCTFRGPVNEKGESSSFQMNASIHFQVSLVIECLFSSSDIDCGLGEDKADIAEFENFIKNRLPVFRIGGGLILGVGNVRYVSLGGEEVEQERRTKKIFRRLLPGYCLVERNALLKEQLDRARAEQGSQDALDAWLEFSAIRHRCIGNEDGTEPLKEGQKAEWEQVPRLEKGWFVPIAVGYRAISPLYSAGEVQRARDPNTPFRFVESAYGLGEWIGVHRVYHFEEVMWRYEVTESSYGWRNRYEDTREIG